MRVGTLAATVFVSMVAVAQASAQSSSDAASQGQPAGLVVWRVVPNPPPNLALPVSLSTQLSTQTAGSFGQPASTVGNTASATGQTSGSFGQPASSSGQTAGSAGQTAGSFGQTSGSFGQTAGSTGQTAGNFGESSTSLAAAAENANPMLGSRRRDAEWDRFTSNVKSEFGAINVIYQEVGIDELESRLHSAAGSSDAPDVLIGTPFPRAWSRQDTGLVRRHGLVTLGEVANIAQEESPDTLHRPFQPQASVLRAAANPTGARAFLLWLDDKSLCQSLCDGQGRIPSEALAAANVARSALYEVLNGQGVGSAADAQAAPFNAQLAQMSALGVYAPDLLTDLTVRVDATAAEANSRFAVVALRGLLENGKAFGVVHAIAVLRADDGGHWRVLQMTPNLQPDQQVFAWTLLHSFAGKVTPENVSAVLGVAQAAPADGDIRERSPELWWDNRGGATLEVVEWQRKAGDSWTNSNLFFVPDDNGHLRTRVTGRFADSPGPYRWRIWSVGRGGVVVFSPWRSINILAH